MLRVNLHSTYKQIHQKSAKVLSSANLLRELLVTSAKRRITEPQQNRENRVSNARNWLNFINEPQNRRHSFLRQIKQTLIGQSQAFLKEKHPDKSTGEFPTLEELPFPFQLMTRYLSEIPQNQRQYSTTVSGRIADSINWVIDRKNSTNGSINYFDYGNAIEVTNSPDLLNDCYKPEFEIGRSLGQFNFKLDEDKAEWIISDRFDFNEMNYPILGFLLTIAGPGAEIVTIKKIAEKGIWTAFDSNPWISVPKDLVIGALNISMFSPYRLARRFLPLMGKPFDIEIRVPLTEEQKTKWLTDTQDPIEKTDPINPS